MTQAPTEQPTAALAPVRSVHEAERLLASITAATATLRTMIEAETSQVRKGALREAARIEQEKTSFGLWQPGQHNQDMGH